MKSDAASHIMNYETTKTNGIYGNPTNPQMVALAEAVHQLKRTEDNVVGVLNPSAPYSRVVVSSFSTSPQAHAIVVTRAGRHLHENGLYIHMQGRQYAYIIHININVISQIITNITNCILHASQ